MALTATAISRDTMTDLFRRGEVLPEGRSVEEEVQLLQSETLKSVALKSAMGA